MNTKQIVFVLLAAFPLLATAQDPAPAPKPAPATEPTATEPAPQPKVAGTTVLVTGVVTATSQSGARSLGTGDPVYVGDTLSVGANSYANVRFEDGGRILLRPNTEFTVESFNFTPADLTGEAEKEKPKKGKAAEAERAFFRLVRGGFRALSGLIKGNAETYKVTTPAATIGIRGTDYEVQLCTDDCPTDQLPEDAAGAEPTLLAASDLSGVQLAQAGGSNPGGVIVATNDGTVVLQTGRGEFVVKVGEVAFALANGQVFMLGAVPDALLLNQTPSPEDCE